MQNALPIGSLVTFTYRTHHLLGGDVKSGFGHVIGYTVVGSDDAYIIKPSTSATREGLRGNDPCVHVRRQGVRLVEPTGDQLIAAAERMRDFGDSNDLVVGRRFLAMGFDETESAETCMAYYLANERAFRPYVEDVVTA